MKTPGLVLRKFCKYARKNIKDEPLTTTELLSVDTMTFVAEQLIVMYKRTSNDGIQFCDVGEVADRLYAKYRTK